MKYELINPSDKIFFEAPDLPLAALAVGLISSMYCAKPIDGGEDTPIFAFIDADLWFKDKTGKDSLQYATDNALAVADVLDTFTLAGERSSLNNICKAAKDTAAYLRKKYGTTTTGEGAAA